MATITIITRKTAGRPALRRALSVSEDGRIPSSMPGRSRPSGRRRHDATSSPARSPTGETRPTLLRALAQRHHAPIDQPHDLGGEVPCQPHRRRREHEEELRLVAAKDRGDVRGSRPRRRITATEIAEWIAALAETRKPGTLGQYLIAFRLLLDHVGVEPNVARDPRVKLPKQVREEPQPPSREHFEAILEALGEKWTSPVRHHRAGCAPPRRGRGAALGRCRCSRSAAPAPEVRDEDEHLALDLPAAVVDGRHRGHLSAGGSGS